MKLNELIALLTDLRDKSPILGDFEVVCAEQETFYNISNVDIELDLEEIQIN